MVTKEQLHSLADLLEQGWTQGVFYRDENGEETGADKACSCCFYGAIYKLGLDEWRVTKEVKRVLGTDAQSLVPWNDAPERTKEEVVSTIRKAAESL